MAVYWKCVDWDANVIVFWRWGNCFHNRSLSFLHFLLIRFVFFVVLLLLHFLFTSSGCCYSYLLLLLLFFGYKDIETPEAVVFLMMMISTACFYSSSRFQIKIFQSSLTFLLWTNCLQSLIASGLLKQFECFNELPQSGNEEKAHLNGKIGQFEEVKWNAGFDGEFGTGLDGTFKSNDFKQKEKF